jgi:pantoate--beta-alanine ligase
MPEVIAEDIAFVPTMGALHAGHLALIQQAKTLSKKVVVSIFVNPLQFENQKDLQNYPRDLDGDIEKAMTAGATEVWAPTYEEVFPGHIMKISAGPVGDIYEGVHRPTHFDGMLTVVNQLFKKVRPKYAIFGEKDFQQLFIIKQWVKDAQIPVKIVAGKTVRDSDGLALSSRNIRLTVEDRKAALVMSRALEQGSKADMLQMLDSEPRFTLDYAEIIDSETFEIATSETDLARGIIAGWINGIRLLDNSLMSLMPPISPISEMDIGNDIGKKE